MSQNGAHSGNAHAEAGHRERLIGRFRRAGMAALGPHEQVELLLTYAIPRRDVKPLARAMLERFGDLRGVLDATEAELGTVPGIGARTATLFRFVRELVGEYLEAEAVGLPVLDNPRGVEAFIRGRLAGRKHEVFMVAYLDAGKRLTGSELLPEGTVDAIVAGHTHQAVAHVVNGIPIVESYSYGRAFGRIDLVVDRTTGRVVEATVHPPKDLCESGSADAGDCVTGSYEGRPVEADPAIAAIIEWINSTGLPVLATDCPSGLDCDTGRPLGSAVLATRTVTFVALKPGFLHPKAKPYTGEGFVAQIGAPAFLIERFGVPPRTPGPPPD